MVSVVRKEIKILKCPHCEKLPHSAPGLKGHITKMHPVLKHSVVEIDESVSKEAKLGCEAKKVVNLLLKKIIEITDDEDCDDGNTLVENCIPGETNVEKKYSNMCDVCGFEVVASKRYIAIQLLSKQKGKCFNNSKCPQCNFRSNDRVTMKRLLRDRYP